MLETDAVETFGFLFDANVSADLNICPVLFKIVLTLFAVLFNEGSPNTDPILPILVTTPETFLIACAGFVLEFSLAIDPAAEVPALTNELRVLKFFDSSGLPAEFDILPTSFMMLETAFPACVGFVLEFNLLIEFNRPAALLTVLDTLDNDLLPVTLLNVPNSPDVAFNALDGSEALEISLT
jgi:hypothetical protein